jgi:hypothetical protein
MAHSGKLIVYSDSIKPPTARVGRAVSRAARLSRLKISWTGLEQLGVCQ